MLRTILVVIAAFSLVSTPLLLSAEKTEMKATKVEKGDREKRAQALLNKAVNLYKEKKEKALPAFMRQGEFIDGELYVFVFGMNGKGLASGGASAALMGRDVSNLRDTLGKPFIQEMIQKAKTEGGGKVEYTYFNRVSIKNEPKITYFQKVDDVVIAVGHYISQADVKQAKTLLEEAVQAVKKDSNAAFAAFNDLNGKFIKDDIYVYVIEMDSKIIRAHGVSPGLINTNAQELRDIKDKPFVKEMIGKAEKRGGGSIVYRWRNPRTNKIETKHTSFRKVDNYLVAVGYFTR